MYVYESYVTISVASHVLSIFATDNIELFLSSMFLPMNSPLSTILFLFLPFYHPLQFISYNPLSTLQNMCFVFPLFLPIYMYFCIKWFVALIFICKLHLLGIFSTCTWFCFFLHSLFHTLISTCLWHTT